jgi:GAF domain-containing protein
MLGEMAVRVMSTRTFEDIVQTILDDVIAFYGAQYGNVQLPVGDHLVIAAQRGFDREFLRTFRRVKKDDGCACGRALQLGQSIVIADVKKDPDYAPYYDAAKSAGYRSVQSTPFITQDGKLIGIVSVHFAAPGGRCGVREMPSASTAMLRLNKHMSCSAAQRLLPRQHK